MEFLELRIPFFFGMQSKPNARIVFNETTISIMYKSCNISNVWVNACMHITKVSLS